MSQYYPINEARKVAAQVATMLLEGNERYAETCAGLIKPSIRDILLFGSCADGEAHEVGDIDMVVLDNGFYSTIFLAEEECGDPMDPLWDSGSAARRKVVRDLLQNFLGFSKKAVDAVLSIPIDLHVMCETIFCDRAQRMRVAAVHHDPEFLKNCFSRFLTFNSSAGEFERPLINTYLSRITQ